MNVRGCVVGLAVGIACVAGPAGAPAGLKPAVAFACDAGLKPCATVATRTAVAPAQDTFEQLLADVQAFRREGFALPVPAGVDARYSARMSDVSPERYAREAEALAAFAARLDAIDRTALPAATQVDAEILFRQLRDRRAEIQFHAYEVPIGSREGFHFDLPA